MTDQSKITHNETVRQRFGKLLYGSGCKTCGINPTMRKVAKQVGIREKILYNFLERYTRLKEGNMIKLEQFLDKIE